MPILPREPDIFPDDVLESEESADSPWWLLYTKSRQEKRIMRLLRLAEVGFYAPMIPQRYRSPAGRLRESYVPLFAAYIFLRGGDEERYHAICTGGITKASPIHEVDQLLADLRQIRGLIEMGVPLSAESRIEPGQPIRVRNGAFKGYEGVVIRRENETRLLVSVRFMEQGVSVKLEDCQVEPVA